MRLLTSGDVELLTQYFLGLSDCTKMLYGPHPFDRGTARELCAERDPLTLRLVTLEEYRGRERIASYVILFLKLLPGDLARYPGLPVEDTASLAPSVRDDLQSTGLGSLVMAELIARMRELMKQDDGVGLAATQLGLPIRLFLANELAAYFLLSHFLLSSNLLISSLVNFLFSNKKTS
jgi:hypothetical protein